MSPTERYECGKCEKTYGTVGHLNRHMRVHTGERPYKCDQCDKSFMRKDHLDEHSFSHTSHRPFACSQCDLKFYTKQKLSRHEALHDRQKQYICEYCSKRFVKKNQLARHRVEHTGKLPFPCPEPGCEQAFSMPSALTRHQQQRHSLSTYLCMEPNCDAVPFTKFSQLQRHLKLHRPVQVHQCDKCGKRFRNSSSLNKHKPTHDLPVADRMIHKCRFPGCSAAYTSSGNLGTHVRSKHLNREAFVCQYCNARFSVKSSYDRHLRNLHGDGMKNQELRFFCRICNTGYPSRATLRRHMRVEHKMPTTWNHDEADQTVDMEPNGSLVYREDGRRLGCISTGPPFGGNDISVVSSSNGDDEISPSKAVTSGAASTETQDEEIRREESEGGRKGYHSEAGRDLLDYTGINISTQKKAAIQTAIQ